MSLKSAKHMSTVRSTNAATLTPRCMNETWNAFAELICRLFIFDTSAWLHTSMFWLICARMSRYGSFESRSMALSAFSSLERDSSSALSWVSLTLVGHACASCPLDSMASRIA